MRVLFAGSSLFDSPIDLTGLEVRPPAGEGDLQGAVGAGARAIGLVDGEFGQRASVRHKEILFALSRGIPVLGASSMGALRYAECAEFGMIGVGKIARDYRSGELVDDADVALLMAPAEFGWAPLSEPLVDVIATLDNLLSRRLITSAQRDLIADRARGLHFTERTEEALFAGQGDDTGLRDLYQAHRFSQKRADAEELVRALQSLSAANVETPRFTLSRSPFWVGPTA